MTVDPDWRGFRRDPMGSLCWNGWAVFGHILPRVGFEVMPCYASGEPVDVIGDGQPLPPYGRVVFVVEWLGRGISFGAPWWGPRPVLWRG